MQNKELQAGTEDEQRTAAESCTSASLEQNGVLCTGRVREKDFKLKT